MKHILKHLCVLFLAFLTTSCHDKGRDMSSYNGTRWYHPYSTHVAGHPDLIYINTLDFEPVPYYGRLLDIQDDGKATLYLLDENDKIISKSFIGEYYFTQLGGDELKIIGENIYDGDAHHTMIVFERESKEILSRNGPVPAYYYDPDIRGFEIDDDAGKIYTRTTAPLSSFIRDRK